MILLGCYELQSASSVPFYWDFGVVLIWKWLQLGAFGFLNGPTLQANGTANAGLLVTSIPHYVFLSRIEW